MTKLDDLDLAAEQIIDLLPDDPLDALVVLVNVTVSVAISAGADDDLMLVALRKGFQVKRRALDLAAATKENREASR